MVRVDELPDDPQLLKQLLADQQRAAAEQLAQRDSQIEQIKREAADQMTAMKLAFEARIAAIFRSTYGPRSERFDPAQLLLFGIQVTTAPLDEDAVADEAGEPVKTRRVHRHGRSELPADLPRTRIEYDLPDDEKNCPHCDKIRQPIGEEISEQLEFVPASMRVLEHVRLKYACKHCEQAGRSPNIVLAVKAPQPIEKGLPGPGLLAHVITSKLADHQPLYRLERIYARHGVTIARSTMCAWMQAAAELVRPLERLLIERVKQSRVIHTDDTRVPVQAPDKCRSGRIWTYIGDEANPYIVYDYTPDRTRAGPNEWLSGYEGYLQADAYGGYDGIYAGGGIIEVACWAHARRKFFDAKDSDGPRCAHMLAMVQKLYAIESKAREMGNDERLALRQEKSVPILSDIKSWLDAESEVVLPRSPVALAIQYVHNQWDALNAYTTQGYLNIDNNAAERALKPVAIGRKNWLFAGNDRGGRTAATLWSLIGSATRHGIDPQRYLTSVLVKIAATPISELEQFLPDVWAREDQLEPVIPDPPKPLTYTISVSD